RHPRGAAAGQGDRAPHPDPRQYALHRRIPLGLPRSGHRVRRGARLPAGGRLPLHRLECVGAHGSSLRKDVPRRARDYAAADRGSVRLMSIRASVHQGGPRGGGGSGARARRRASQRPGGGAHVRRQGRVRRASSEVTAPRASRDPGSGGVHATRQRNESRRGATLRREAAAPPRDRGGPLGFPGRRVGRPARTARRRPRRRRDHDRRSAGTRAPGRRVGRHGGRGDRPAGAARHEPRADPHARARRRRTAAPGASPEAGPGGRGPRGAAHQRAVRRAAAPRVRRAGTAAETMTPRCAALGILVSWRVALGQGSWTATPASPTVGDTVWLERQTPVPAGWRVRPGKLDATERVEPLADPSVRRAPQGWLVRYPIVAWAPGPGRVALEPEVADARWLAAGEPKAVAARAAFQLRLAVARAIPEAGPALSTAECLAAVERARPHAPLRELRELLEQLDRVAF